MANIKVDHRQLELTADAVKDYINDHRTKMKNIGLAVDEISASWQGADYDQLCVEWQQIGSKDSTCEQMLLALESFEDFLRFSANKYKAAQAQAISRANRLPK